MRRVVIEEDIDIHDDRLHWYTRRVVMHKQCVESLIVGRDVI